MSKSLASPLGLIYLNDDPHEIDKKIKKAVTDTDNEVRLDWEKKPGCRTCSRCSRASRARRPKSVAERYQRYGDLKKDLAELRHRPSMPMQRRYANCARDEGALQSAGARAAPRRRRGRWTALRARGQRDGPLARAEIHPVQLEAVRATSCRRAR